MLPAAFEETFSLNFVAEVNITIKDFLVTKFASYCGNSTRIAKLSEA